MKNLIILISLATLSITTLSQNKIQLQEVNCKPKVHEYFNQKDVKYIISPNQKNAIVLDVDKEKTDKEKNKKINLLNQNGEIIASTSYLCLYDAYVIPLGDNNTVLAGVYPIGVCINYFRIYKKVGDSLRVVKEISEPATTALMDFGFNGKYIAGIYTEGNKPKHISTLKLYDNNGNTLQSTVFQNAFNKAVKFASKSEFLILANSKQDSSQVILYDSKGQMKVLFVYNSKQIPEISFYDNDNYLTVMDRNNLFLYDLKQSKLIFQKTLKTSDVVLNSSILNAKGDLLFATVTLKRNSLTHSYDKIPNTLYVYKNGNEFSTSLNHFQGMPQLTNTCLEFTTENKKKKECYEIHY